MKIESPWIQTTDDCNCQCSYCYMTKSNNDMNKTTFDNFVTEKLCEIREKKVDAVVMRIAGGEPLLNFDAWKDGVSLFLENTKSPSGVQLITNLTYLPNGFCKYLEKNKIWLNVSLDSLSDSKPFKVLGTSSAPIVMANIEKVKQKNLCILTVINPTNVNDLPELAEWIGQHQYEWHLSLDYFYNGNPPPETIKESLKKAIKRLSMWYDYDYFRKFYFELCSFYWQDGCEAGKNNYAIDTQGKRCDCQTLFGQDKKVIVKQDEKCKKCSVFTFCKGGCPLHNTEQRKSLVCDIVKMVAKETGRIIVRSGKIGEENSEV